VDPIDLGQDNDRWLVGVNTAMKITYPQNTGIFLNSRGTLNFQGLCSIELVFGL
jgi:hypothetical protein